MLSKRQKQILEFVKKTTRKQSYSPTLEEIRRKFKLASVSTAHFHISKLRDLGYLAKEENRARSISLLDQEYAVKIPIIGSIAAGTPVETLEVPEGSISVSRKEISNHGKYYALRVKGDSMINEGIFNGDIVVIRRQETAENGQTVVAIIDNGEATLKKIYREAGRIRLQPANQTMLPIYRDEVEVRGVVVKIIRTIAQTLSPIQSQETVLIPVKNQKRNFQLDSIYNMDCLTFMRKIEDESINLIFADPPYNLSKSNFKMKFKKTGGADLSTNKGKWDLFSENEYEEFTKKWLKESFRVLKSGGTIWVAGSYHNIYLTGHLMRKAGFEILGEILWHKTDATPNLSCTRFVADHENFIWARKGKKNVFNYDLMRTENSGKQMRSIWSRGKTAGGKRIHPTQKPDWLLERIILSTSQMGDIVFDPFLGSGTTAVVAKRLKRKFLGTEIDPSFYKAAKNRIAETYALPN